MLDNDEIELTDEVKKQILDELLPNATRGHSTFVNGDMKDRAQSWN